MKRRLLVFLSALATVLAVLPAGAASGALAQAQSDKASSVSVVDGGLTAGAAIFVDDQVMKSAARVPIIIKLDEQAVASYEGGVSGFTATSPKVTGTSKLDASSLDVQSYRRYLAAKNADFKKRLEAAVDGAEVTRTYEMVIGGLAAIVPGSSIVAISKMDGVEAVYADTLNTLDTDVSPGFIGAPTAWNALGGQESAGEGVIVGVIDTGIWPEHPSFADPDPFGNSYPAPPSTPATCDFGNTAYNPNDAPFTCNNKLIGAYEFLDTYKAVVGLIPTEFDSARDSNGHGTHTSSTAAGNGGVEASIFGVSRGTVSGIAPRSHVIMYRGCGLDGCYSSDSSAAVAQAIIDGVDVLNYSISGGGAPYGDAVSLAFLDAYNAGMLVNPSAGNSGPGADTVAHREPWTLTVAASTTDRHFLATVSLVADNADTLDLTGASVTAGISTPTPVIFAPGGATDLCLTPFPAGTFSGEIVICERGDIARVAKSYNVAAGGAGGLLLYNPTLQGLATDNHFIPSIHLENDSGAALVDFMNTHTGVMATMTDGTATTVQGDKIAAFSSRGGPAQSLGISKPDIAAPGVQILAGHTPLPEDEVGGLPGQLFQSIQGTSMAAPHITGAAALMKAMHPDWTPGQIKSALMTTAVADGVTKEDGSTPADPFDMGTGRVDLTDAGKARMTVSDTGANFLALEDHLWDANLPSIYIPTFAGQNTLERTFENMTDHRQVYTFEIMKPSDLRVIFGTVVDGKFYKKRNGQFGIPPSGSATHHIKVDGRDMALGEVAHAWIKFTNKNHPSETHLFPITVVRTQAGVTVESECAPTTVGLGDSTSCSVTVENTTFDTQHVSLMTKVPSRLDLHNGSVVGETKIKSGQRIRLLTDLYGATAPVPNVAVDNLASPAGYLDLAGFSPYSVTASDESIENWTVPAFDYAGESYDTIGIVSNGYIVVGGGTGADVNYINSDLPDAGLPNNVLAPFWTDLNPDAGGNVYIQVLGDGSNTWTVVEWQGVPNYGDGEPNTFQVWLGANSDTDPGEDISFTYASVSDGDGGFLTVGAENSFGSEGGTVYFDGAGTAPAPSFGGGNATCDASWPNPPCYEVDVFSVPGAPGETHVITFDATGDALGAWAMYTRLTSTAFPGKAWAKESGQVVP